MDIEIHRIALANPPIVKQMWHEDRRLTHKAQGKAEAEEFRRVNAQEEEEGDEVEEYQPRPSSTPQRRRTSPVATRSRPVAKRAATRQAVSGSGPTPKRQRVELVEPTQATAVNPTQVLSAKARGKQRAEESDEESLFGDRDIDWESSQLV